MSNKDHKKQPSLFESLRRSLVRSEEMRSMLTTQSHLTTKDTKGPITTRREGLVRSEEMRPMLPAQSHVATKGPAATRRENFEISVRDKSDATAKRGFRVQVPKRMLTYTVLIFFVAPLFLFGYMEVHNRAHHHHPQGDSKGHEYFPTDILSSLLTDSQEEDALNSPATDTEEASLDAENATSIGDIATTNSTLEQGSKDSATDADMANQMNSDEQPTDEKDKVDDDQADTQKGERRVLRQSRR